MFARHAVLLIAGLCWAPSAWSAEDKAALAKWNAVVDGFKKLGARHSDNEVHPETRQKIHTFYMPRNTTDSELKRLPASPCAFSLDLQYCKITDDGLEELSKVSNLTGLSLAYTPVTDAGLVHLKGLTSLTRLSLKGTEVSDDGLPALADLTNLEKLDLTGSKISEAGLQNLKELKKLNLLELSEEDVTDQALADLHEIGLLHALWIAELERGRRPTGVRPKNASEVILLNLFKTQVTDEGLKELKDLKNLAYLSLNETQETDVALATLREIGLLHAIGSAARGAARKSSEVQSVSLKTKVTPRGLLELKDFKNVNLLTLDRRLVQDQTLVALNQIGLLHALWLAEGEKHARPSNAREVLSLSLSGTIVTDVGMKELATFPNLTKLELHSLAITDAGLRDIAAFKNLIDLDLTRTKVTDDGMKDVKGLNKLASLSLPDGVIGPGLKELKGLTALKSLNIRATDQILAALRESGMLHILINADGQGRQRPAVDEEIVRLDLFRTSVTDGGLKELTGLTNLKYLNLADTKVTKAGVETLKQSLPDCQIRR